jgi:hypothetical protein
LRNWAAWGFLRNRRKSWAFFIALLLDLLNRVTD